MERRKHERERRYTHRDQRDLKQPGINFAAFEPGVKKEQHECENRDVRPTNHIRAIDVGCGNIFSHRMSPILMFLAAEGAQLFRPHVRQVLDLIVR